MPGHEKALSSALREKNTASLSRNESPTNSPREECPFNFFLVENFLGSLNDLISMGEVEKLGDVRTLIRFDIAPMSFQLFFGVCVFC